MSTGAAILLVGSLFGAGGLGGFLSAWFTRRTGKESNLTVAQNNLTAGQVAFINELQEQLVEEKRVRQALSEEFAAFRTKVEERMTAQDDYIEVLREHIFHRKGPPPPARPKGVTA